MMQAAFLMGGRRGLRGLRSVDEKLREDDEFSSQF